MDWSPRRSGRRMRREASHSMELSLLLLLSWIFLCWLDELGCKPLFAEEDSCLESGE